MRMRGGRELDGAADAEPPPLPTAGVFLSAAGDWEARARSRIAVGSRGGARRAQVSAAATPPGDNGGSGSSAAEPPPLAGSLTMSAALLQEGRSLGTTLTGGSSCGAAGWLSRLRGSSLPPPSDSDICGAAGGRGAGALPEPPAAAAAAAPRRKPSAASMTAPASKPLLPLLPPQPLQSSPYAQNPLMAPVAPRPPTQPRQPPQPLQQLLLPAPSLLPLPPVPGLTVLHPSLSPLCAPGGAAALFGGPGARFWSSGVAAAAPATAATTAAAAAASAAAAAFDGSEDVLEWPHRPVLAVGCVASAGGVSWRGRNPGGDKTNQDSVVLAEHAPSRSLLAGVFDGHGSQGRHVSRYFASVYPAALFGDPRFGRCMARTAAAGDAAAALSDGTHSTVSPRGGGVVFRDFCAATAAAAAAATASPSPTRRRSRSGAAGLRGAGGGSTGSRRSASAAPVGCSRHSDDVGGGDDRDSRGGGSGASSHDSPSPQHTQRRSGGSRSSPTHAHTLGLELCALMADVLLETEARLLSSSLIDTALSGTTCVLSLLRGGLVYTVNVGDSRSVLVRAPSALVPVREVDLAAASAVSTPTGDAVPGLALGLIPPPPPQPPPGEPPPPPDTITGAHHFAGPGHPPLASPAVAPACLTVDHKPDDPPERRRIAAAGGRVVVGAVPGLRHIAGPARVWLPALQLPGLNMSRSLCDGLAKGAGVVSAPHGSVAVLSPVHRALVLGSDGVWDFVSPGEAGTLALSTANATEAAARLARLARSRWLHRTAGADDTTAVVVRLAPPDRELPPPQY